MTLETELFEARTREELDEIGLLLVETGHNPYRTIDQFLYPMYGHPAANPDECVKSAQERRWAEHCKNPGSHWIYVRAKESGTMIGVTEWLFYEENPFPHGIQPIRAPWWPPGDGRAFTENILNQLYKPRQIFMRRPHAALSSMAVLEAYRRHGVATQLMDWGIKRVDELDLELFIESSRWGRWLFEKYARLMFTIYLDVEKLNPSNEWRALASQFGESSRMHVIWRPKQGKWTDQGPQGPWDVAGPTRVDLE